MTQNEPVQIGSFIIHSSTAVSRYDPRLVRLSQMPHQTYPIPGTELVIGVMPRRYSLEADGQRYAVAPEQYRVIQRAMRRGEFPHLTSHNGSLQVEVAGQHFELPREPAAEPVGS